MKKKLAIVLTAVLVLLSSACGAQKTEKTTDRLEAIRQRGYIELCTEPYFAPYEFIDTSKTGDAQYVGVDMEIGKYIAQKLGVELKIVPLEFGAVLAGIAEGKYDMAISALAYSPARAETMTLSNSYYTDGTMEYGYLLRTEDAGKYESIEAVKNAVVVTQSGSVQEAIVNAQITESKQVKLVSSMTDGYLMVSEGKADVCVCSKPSAKLYAEANGGLTLSDFSFTVDENMNGTVVGLPKGEQALVDFVNECIAELKEDGSITKWTEEYNEYAKTLGVS